MNESPLLVFPTTEANYLNENVRTEGMTLRDHFAAKAMSGDWAAQDSEDIGAFPCDIDEELLIKRAQLYYRMADAMLKARSLSNATGE